MISPGLGLEVGGAQPPRVYGMVREAGDAELLEAAAASARAAPPSR